MRRRAGRAAPLLVIVTEAPPSPAALVGALSVDEQRIWDETVHGHEAEAREALPAVVVGGSWGAVLLVLFGVPMAGLAIGAATGVAWLVWRFGHG